MKLGAVFGGLALVGLIASGPLVYRSWQSVKYRNLRAVEPGRVYRSGQMSPAGFEAAIRDLGVRTIVSFRDTRDDGREPDDDSEEDVCRRHGVAFHTLPKADWSPGPDGVISGDRNVDRLFKLLADPGTEYPVLMHCFAGIHRTGAYCAVYRLETGWSAEEAKAELVAAGTRRTTFAPNLMQYLDGYKRGRLSR
jgi:protein tyrosine/serine phosphatase